MTAPEGESCETCSSASTCSTKKPGGAPSRLEPNPLSRIGRVVAVMSGKGGVGKSSLSALLAAGLTRQGHPAGLLDADITGPSIPRLFGLHERPESSELGLYPVTSPGGVRVMSLNLLLEEETQPVIWRGPLIAGAVQQFWTDVIWGDLDYLVIDLPPGTGDSPLTIMQSLPLDGVLIATTPQALAGMVVRKAVTMAEKLGVKVLGLVENMSYVKCPDCGTEIPLFGGGREARREGLEDLELLAALPFDPALLALADAGKIEEYRSPDIDRLVKRLTELTPPCPAGEAGEKKEG